MSILQFLYLCGVIAGFLAFALTLAWGERRTHDFVRPDEAVDTASSDDHGFKKAA